MTVDVEDVDYDDMIDQIRDLIGDIRTKEAKAIGESGKWDMEKISRNYEYSKQKDVEDIVGFMIKAVKEDWAVSEKKPRKAQKANDFDNFTGRGYTKEDFDEMFNSTLR